MILSFKYKPRWQKLELNIIEELSFHLSKLYNIINYDFHENGYQCYPKVELDYRSIWHRKYLHSHNYQQCLRVLDQDWKSYFNGSKDFTRHPDKYKGAPKKPGYKNNKRKAEVIFTNYAVKLGKNQLLLSLSKKIQEKFNVKSLNLPFPIAVAEQVNFESIQQVKLRWRQSEKLWEVIIIHKKVQLRCPSNHKNIMSIDLGLDNLCAITFSDTMGQYLINGKSLKSKNSYFNKEIARLTKVSMIGTRSTTFRPSKRLQQLQRKHNNVVRDVLHKISREVVRLAKQNQCSTIVIGNLKGIKYKNYCKSFTQIPIVSLVSKIEYKAKLIGISVVKVKEHYTSGVSAYDLEPITKEYYNKKQRIKRGLFKTKNGFLVNSDINGSLNILRRYLEENKMNVVPILISRLRDNGCMDHPVRLLIL